MSASANRLQATLFEPNGDTMWLTSCFKSNPRFLFRVHAPRTSGQTEPTFVASTGAGECHKDVLQLDKSAAKLMIIRHLTNFERGKDDNFMSWANSLLFAIVYALWRATNSDPGQVKISVLDASQLPPEACIPVVPLLDAYNINETDNKRLDRKWFHEEYLTQGRLDIPQGAMETFTLKSLIDYGLFNFYPAFEEDYDTRIYKRVEMLRYHRIDVPTLEKISKAADIAEGCCSAIKFHYSLFAGLLSLKRCGHKVQDMVEVYHGLRAGWDPIPLDTVVPLEVVSDEVPEYKRHVRILQDFKIHEEKIKIHEGKIKKTQKPRSRRKAIFVADAEGSSAQPVYLKDASAGATHTVQS
ncbi:hypothetical protein E8E11_008844 [Didymella keratinophila]|nr:hypothetical protein E8E11_008844 [Didymella keratinophila]